MARLFFGTEPNVKLSREPTAVSRVYALMDTFWMDLKHSLRGLFARPGFTALVVVPLALGIGLNTAIFSAVYTVLLRSVLPST